MKTAHLTLAVIALAASGCDSCGGKGDSKNPTTGATSAGAGNSVGPVILAPDGGTIQVQAAITEDVAGKVGGPLPKDGKLKGAGTPMAVQCKAGGQPISPGIYGIAWAELDKELGATEHRWGGNTTSRYNPKLGKAWSSANDWFFENTEPDWTWQEFVAKAAAKGGKASITIPMLGWVAKDTESCAYTAKEYPKQEKFDSQRKQCGNGKKADGKTYLDPPKDPSKWQVKFTPADAAAWVTQIKANDAKNGKRTVFEYILDNEPGLWDSSHHDVHPEGSTYDEMLEKTIAYATAIRKADPDALIAGPAEWGWPSYFFSGKDAKAGFQVKPDRRAHGDTPFLEWYLKKIAEYEKANNIKLLDILDVHIYPQADGVQRGEDDGSGDGAGDTDPATNQLRLRTTRSLWDREYMDESWIKDKVYLIPRMKDIIAANHPGLGFQIGEYNFGAEKHINGAVAQAEAFGRFAQFGVSHAFYWTFPKAKTPVYWAFRAFRNYDGAGGRFLDTMVPSSSPSGTSLFASRDETGKKWVLVALNFSADHPFDATINLDGCAAPTGAKAFRYAGADSAIVAGTATVQGSGLQVKLPPMSINVFEVTTQ